MQRKNSLIDRRLARILMILQWFMVLLVAGGAWLLEGAVIAKSSALGALLCCVASNYFAWQSFRFAGARASQQVMLSMYRGLIGKFAIVIVGLVLIFSYVKPLSAGALFAGFILVQAMSWVAPMLWSRYFYNKASRK